MKTLVNMCVSGMLALVVTSGGVLAQSATSAEARLKEKNIALPPVPPPVANYVVCASRKIVVSCRKHRWGRGPMRRGRLRRVAGHRELAETRRLDRARGSVLAKKQ
jgi:hypothetical protein